MRRTVAHLPKPFRRLAPLRRLRSDEGGGTAIIFALSILPLVAGAGMAVDGLYAFMVRSELGHAVDAAALAGARAFYDPTRDTQVEQFFRANFRGGVPVEPLTISADEASGIVSVSAAATAPTHLMKLFGFDSVRVEASAAAQIMGAGGMEMALVLDVTGSMKGSKLQSLKAAASDLLDTLYRDKETVKDLWVGVVPFAGRVNIKPHRDWMTSQPLLWQLWWAGCADERSGARANDDSPPSEERFPEFTPGGSVLNAWQYCPPNPVLPLTAEKSRITAVIDDLEAEGNTRTDIGMAWGWRVLSPRWRGVWESGSTWPANYDSTKVRKVVVLMTDGENTPHQSGDPQSEAQTYSLLAETCEAMKAEGITIYTITFQAPEDLDPIYAGCATTPEHHFINAPTEEALEQAFGRIGGELASQHVRLIR